MARTNRRDVLADGEIQVVHCINRCVRRTMNPSTPVLARSNGAAGEGLVSLSQCLSRFHTHQENRDSNIMEAREQYEWAETLRQ